MNKERRNINQIEAKGSTHVTEEIVVNNFAEVVWEAIPKKNSNKYPVVLHEVDCHRGRADVVCAVMRKNNNNYFKLRDLGIALSQPAKAKILSWIDRKNPYLEEDICRVTGLRLKTVRKHLKELSGLGFIRRLSTGGWVLTKEYRLPDIDIWAFEVKLSNWKRAYYQTLRYKGFSHYTAVVMPAKNLKSPTNNIDMFDKMNIGLMAIDPKGKLRFIKKPKRNNPTSKKHYLYALGQVITEYCHKYPELQNNISHSSVPRWRRLLNQILLHLVIY